MNNLKIPTDNSFSFVLGFIVLTCLIGYALYKIDGLIEVIIQFLFTK